MFMICPSQPLVSVIIPVYNGENYVEDCIQSVIHQTYHTLEIIIVNDGSTDDTSAIIEKYVASDVRIQLINKQNSGPALAREVAVAIAKGEYIQYLDSDDTLLENAIELLVTKAEETNADIVAAPFYFCSVDEPKRRSVSLKFNSLSGIEYFKEILYGRAYWSVWSNFQRLSFLRDCSIVPATTIAFGEDAMLMIQLLTYAKKVVAIDVPIINYSIRTSSLSHPEVEKVSDKTYNDMRTYSVWMENYLRERGLLDELEEEMTFIHLEQTFLSMYWKRFEDAHADLRKLASKVKKYPSLKKRLTKRQSKLLFVYQISGVLGDFYLSYYKHCRKV